MITVTDRAAEYLKGALASIEEPENACFRLLVGEQGPQLAIDQPQPEDDTLEHDGDVVLAVDSATDKQFEGRQIDFDETQSRLVVTNMR